MSNLKQQLIRLGSKNPQLQKHLRPILDKITGQRSRTAFRFDENPEWGKMVSSLLERYVEDYVDDYEGYNFSIDKQGQTTDSELEASGVIAFGLLTSTGAWPRGLSNEIGKAQEKIYRDAKEHWIKNNQDLIKQHGLRPDQINYNDLNDLDLWREAEELSEIEMEAQHDEHIYPTVSVSLNDYDRGQLEGELKVRVMGGFVVSGYYMETTLGSRYKNIYMEEFKVPRDPTKAARAITQHIQNALRFMG